MFSIINGECIIGAVLEIAMVCVFIFFFKLRRLFQSRKTDRKSNKKERYQSKGKVIMKNRKNHIKVICWIFICTFILTGCANNYGAEKKISIEDGKEELREEKDEKTEIDSSSVSSETNTEDSIEDIVIEPETVCVDWSEYFNGLNGTAVVYDTSNRQYTIYNKDLAETRRSPCSTFKIISSLIALENGIIIPENSTRTWSGEIFWNEDWNKDIDFSEAFRTSCVWYYRQVIDDIGKDMMQKELDKLRYGNCDISDWEGRLNTNNNNRALTGFWIESSLLISPKEQVEVMERIFGSNSDYSEETQNELRKVMLVPEQDRTDISIYGKTGLGAANDIVVDAWFTGFAESTTGNIYFCVRLGRTDGMDVSSTMAKEIAIKIVSDYCMQ